MSILKRVPTEFLPRPLGTREKACLAILLGIPTTNQLIAGFHTAAEAIAAEQRRIAMLGKI